jgi:hypothetical protein
MCIKEGIFSCIEKASVKYCFAKKACNGEQMQLTMTYCTTPQKTLTRSGLFLSIYKLVSRKIPGQHTVGDAERSSESTKFNDEL